MGLKSVKYVVDGGNFNLKPITYEKFRKTTSIRKQRI
jgi:hypothetical protein